MTVLRKVAALTLCIGALAATPASAQFFLKSHDMSGPPMRGDEPSMPQLPGATPQELRANMVWTLRSALNVAALQCQFAPGLLSVENYNIVLDNHKDELKASFDTISRYFTRTAKGIKPGQMAMDRHGTRTYSAFTAVGAQYGFCQTAAEVATRAVYAPRGGLYQVAVTDMSALRNALVPWGEQYFPGRVRIDTRIALPRFDAICWSPRGEWVSRKCGPFVTTAR